MTTKPRILPPHHETVGRARAHSWRVLDETGTTVYKGSAAGARDHLDRLLADHVEPDVDALRAELVESYRAFLRGALAGDPSGGPRYGAALAAYTAATCATPGDVARLLAAE